MSKQRSSTPPQHLPGNDGGWFLKAVGVDQTVTDLGDMAMGEGDSTSESVAGLWQASGDAADPLTDWSPGELSKSFTGKRNFRWSIVISALVVVAAVVAVAVWLPGTSDRRALARSNEYAAAFGTLLPDLPPTQQALATLTEPESDVSQFAELIPVISEASLHADAALDLASQPLPRPWPLASSVPFTELTPYRDALSVHATTAKAITRRLNDLLVYRTVLEDFLVIEMPTSAEGVDINALTAELATATADGSALLGELPDDAALAEHKAAAEALLTRFGDLQVDYLDALRNDREADAADLVDEFLTARLELDQQLVEALGRMRSEIDDSLIALNGSIEETLNSMPGV